MSRPVLSLILSAWLVASAKAEIVTEAVEYQDGETALHGRLAWDDSIDGPRPGVLVVHEWWGLNDYARQRAEELAKLGYVAFALDMYGAGKVTEHAKQAGEWAGVITKNESAWRKRALAGLDVLKQRKEVDRDRLAAVGYCFGGATVCQLAYGDADLKGVVSFHGSLPLPKDGQTLDKSAKLLICHGAADAFVPAAKIDKFQEALEKAGADWQMIVYANARHSFTNPGADSRGIDGLRYNKEADQRSWQHMQMFFDELFGNSND
ncbi:dienelactone hydrolase family protein [Pirellulales bacterium]|nr:dienelactone hydrolase family protein [Pirellulales bacterium]